MPDVWTFGVPRDSTTSYADGTRYPTVFDRFPEHEAAYLAGIIDGEGHIGVYLRRDSSRPRPAHVLEVVVVNTNFELICLLRERVGAGNIKRKHRGGATHRRPAWHWTVRSRQAENLLRATRPYLTVKARQADLALAFRRTFDRPTGPLTAPPETVRERDRLAQAIREANRA